MPYRLVKPIVDLSVRKLCFQPYINHSRGCPNYGKNRCPPKCPTIDTIIDLSKPIFAIWNVFDFATHCQKMKNKHSNWTQRQVECCLYWQPKARKQLKQEIINFLLKHPKYFIVKNPEGSGVNVTQTMKNIEEILEWPPKTKTYQVALGGVRL